MYNARIHHAAEFKLFIHENKLPVPYSGVPSCEIALVERLFAILKRGFVARCIEFIESRIEVSNTGGCKPLTEHVIMQITCQEVDNVKRDTIQSLFPSMLKNLDLYL